jgi:predicted DNA binding CopG/RHH family protein
MGDAGEGLIDAEDRLQQWVADREQQKQRKGVAAADPERERKLSSLRLAKAELERQRAVTESPIRQKQIVQALQDLERQIRQLGSA